MLTDCRKAEVMLLGSGFEKMNFHFFRDVFASAFGADASVFADYPGIASAVGTC
jgi:hypothetical protein